jgi:hypothetical protein
MSQKTQKVPEQVVTYAEGLLSATSSEPAMSSARSCNGVCCNINSKKRSDSSRSKEKAAPGQGAALKYCFTTNKRPR